jgi:CRISPR/Cas system CSM-associated protein Csm3 (group 7 of RAMP superfamily)
VHRGGERGEVHALVGRISVRCNALAAWALTLARVYGLGGLTSQGFGRVRVEVESL